MTLMAHALVTFSLINTALFDLRPEQFAYSSVPSGPVLVNYSLASLWVGEISALTASGPISASINVFAGISAGFVLLVLVVTLIFGLRQSKDEAIALDEIGRMRRRADEFAERLGHEHDLTVEELHAKLSELGYYFVRVVDYLTRELADGPRAESP